MRFLPLILFVIFSYISVDAQDWQSDLKTCQETAKAKNQRIILVFQGSDWCAPCIKLEKEIWNSKVFTDYAKAHFVMLKADFPRKKKNKLSKEQQNKNNQLAEKYNPHGVFPLVVVLDAKGKVLGTTSYKKVSPTEYINIINSF